MVRVTKAYFNYNYSYLSEVFASTTGKTLRDYYREKKLSVATHLLRDSDRRVCEIAEMLNYSTPYAFTNAFKSAFGLSPLAYRRSAVPIQK